MATAHMSVSQLIDALSQMNADEPVMVLTPDDSLLNIVEVRTDSAFFSPLNIVRLTAS